MALLEEQINLSNYFVLYVKPLLQDDQKASVLSNRQQKSADRVEKERWKGVALKIKSINKRKGKNLY